MPSSCNECFRCRYHYHIRANRIGCNNPDGGLVISVSGGSNKDYLYPTCFDPELKPRSCKHFAEFDDTIAEGVQE